MDLGKMNLRTLQLPHNIIESLDDKIKCNCVLLYLSKGFDCIQHDILMDKLYKYGVLGILHKLIESYLKIRTQYVKVTHRGQSNEGIFVREPSGQVWSSPGIGPWPITFYIVYK
jgi:hypothetical protein